MLGNAIEIIRPYYGFIICTLACGLMIWSFYPGMMAPDSLNNLAQGREGVFSDINAPLLSYMMGVLDRIVPGPGLIFVIHLLVFWAASALLWYTVSVKSFGLGLAILLVGLTPHILGQPLLVIKDVALAVGLFAAVSLLFFAKGKKSRVAVLLTPIPLFYALAARLNAFPAVIPIVIWAGFVFVEVFEIEVRQVATIAIGMAYLLILAIGVYLVDRRLTNGETAYPFQQIYLYDLAALSVDRNEILFPSYITDAPGFSMDIVRERYNPTSVGDLIFADIPNTGDKPPLALTSVPENVVSLRAAWMTAVVANPAGYFRHRARIFAKLVGLNKSVTIPYWFFGFSTSPAEFRGSENVGFTAVMKYLSAFRRPVMQTFFHRAFIWLGLSGYFLYKSLRNRLKGGWQVVFVLTASSLMYSLAYFPTTPSTEFRYLFWPALASAVAIIMGIFLIRTTRVEERAAAL